MPLYWYEPCAVAQTFFFVATSLFPSWLFVPPLSGSRRKKRGRGSNTIISRGVSNKRGLERRRGQITDSGCRKKCETQKCA